ncbi:hypothetical protein [Sphingomicrobium arenosum]|uniref:hypothetical protein n=1 Tax=Sphingomicrobium arenosum TaxID=2233861 RepID=UPI002240C71C|nr:hypothetical protein [Sphingomicrobium arenosum]
MSSDRLSAALARAETACERIDGAMARIEKQSERDDALREDVRAALAELDQLIAARENEDAA